MPEREKIIRALECCLDIVRSGRWASGCIACPYVVEENRCREKMILDAIALLKEQEDCIRILTSDLEDLQKEHAKLLDKKIPLITNGQEVVRCADCKHHGKDVCGAASGIAYPPPDDWFCADGERR